MTNSVYLGGMLYERDDICDEALCIEREKGYSSLRKRFVQRNGGVRICYIFEVETLRMCWRRSGR